MTGTSENAAAKRRLVDWPWWGRALVYAAGNVLIAGFLTGIGFGSGFWINLVFSQCIGMTIFFTIEAAFALLGEGLRHHRPWVAMAAVVAGSLVGTALGGAVTGVHLLFGDWRPTIYWQSVLMGLLFGGVITSLFMFRQKLHEVRDALQSERLRTAEAERAEAETQLRLLRAQVEPHFLFNTLAHVASLMGTDTSRARELLDRLIHYLRGALRHSRQEQATLDQELEIVAAYLELMRERMPARLSYHIDCPAALRRTTVPPMTLQPLVENAIKHGLEPKTEGGRVDIAGWGEPGRRVIEVRDTGQGLGEAPGGSGNGLANLRERLRALYGAGAALALEEDAGGGVIARITLPEDRP
ncbi:MAG: histidine kinase [Gammaproteobacteria bacterium]|nr:histidine kinase [Gammaproteobacteria bacterium]